MLALENLNIVEGVSPSLTTQQIKALIRLSWVAVDVKERKSLLQGKQSVDLTFRGQKWAIVFYPPAKNIYDTSAKSKFRIEMFPLAALDVRKR